MNAIGADSNDWDKCFKLMADIDLSGYTGPGPPLPPPPPTPPPSIFKASNPNPADGAFSVSTTAYLSWTAGYGATSHDVYFGTTSTPPFVCNQTFTTFDPGTMPNDTTYYWRIDEVNDLGTTTGDIWSFTTMMSTPPPPPPPPTLPLMADFDLSKHSEQDFNIIGNEDNPFTGVFDGNGHTISNFTSRSSGTYIVGLFGYIDDPNTEISNLGLIDPNVDAGTGWFIGSLVGNLGSGTIRNCFVSGSSVAGGGYVGGLVGGNWQGKIYNCHSSGTTDGTSYVGGLVAHNHHGTITNCSSNSSVTGIENVGVLIGANSGTITDCCSEGDVLGNTDVGGLIGSNGGNIINSYSEASVSGTLEVGGLVGRNDHGTITNCSAGGSVVRCWSGMYTGGLVGLNEIGAIINCYSTNFVIGSNYVGGLVGENFGLVSNCYSYSEDYVFGTYRVGGLVGRNLGIVSNCYSTNKSMGGGLVGENWGNVAASFWDIETSGKDWSDGGTGLPTDRMQIMSTFTDAGWDFNTPIWTIDEGIDYPRLWWEFEPVLHAEPEVTLGISNAISWEPVIGGVEYFAECAEDANFTSIIYSTDWITETTYEFTGLELGKSYWYSVKARNAASVESQWSNVESSLQCALSDAVEKLLKPESLKGKNLKRSLLNKITIATDMIDNGLYTDAMNKLQNDILQKTNGCAEMGQPDKNDWIINCEQQAVVYPLIIETIEHVRSFLE
jgi:hypothetical protein